MLKFQKVAIVGVGLMGGSIGLALKKRKIAQQVLGVGHQAESLEKALASGAVDEVTSELGPALEGAEVVIVATPVALVADTLCRVAEIVPDAHLITDIASTKAAICAKVEQQLSPDSPAAQVFVGSHPLAGGHRTGPENARADLLDGRTVVVTPTDATPGTTIERAQALWQALGSRVVTLSPEGHDRALATTSHLPHLAAAALVAATPYEWLTLAASGWADTTRIAASDPKLWTQIFVQNRVLVLESLERFIAQLRDLREDLTNEDWPQIQNQLENAKRTRDALGN